MAKVARSISGALEHFWSNLSLTSPPFTQTRMEQAVGNPFFNSNPWLEMHNSSRRSCSSYLLNIHVTELCMEIGKLKKEIVNPNMSTSLQSDPLRLTCNPKMLSMVFPNRNSSPSCRPPSSPHSSSHPKP